MHFTDSTDLKDLDLDLDHKDHTDLKLWNTPNVSISTSIAIGDGTETRSSPNQNPKLLVDSLLLGGKKYTVDNVSALPYPELQPKQVFTPVANGITAFFSKESPLSNHFEVSVCFEGKQCMSSEQCYMYQKAVYFRSWRKHKEQ